MQRKQNRHRMHGDLFHAVVGSVEHRDVALGGTFQVHRSQANSDPLQQSAIVREQVNHIPGKRRQLNLDRVYPLGVLDAIDQLASLLIAGWLGGPPLGKRPSDLRLFKQFLFEFEVRH